MQLEQLVENMQTSTTKKINKNEKLVRAVRSKSTFGVFRPIGGANESDSHST